MNTYYIILWLLCGILSSLMLLRYVLPDKIELIDMIGLILVLVMGLAGLMFICLIIILEGMQIKISNPFHKKDNNNE